MFYLAIALTVFFHGLQNTRHSLTGPSPEYRLKEKYFLRKIEINNLDDTEGNKYKIFKNNFVRMIVTFRAVSQHWLTQFDIKMMILFWHSAPNLTFQVKIAPFGGAPKGRGWGSYVPIVWISNPVISISTHLCVVCCHFSWPLCPWFKAMWLVSILPTFTITELYLACRLASFYYQ